MKRMITLISILMLFSACLTAPSYPVVVIIAAKVINYYTPLIHAIGMVEGKCDTLAYNPLEEATGYFQIRPIRLNDYNKRAGKDYTLDQMYNYEIAKEIFLYYTNGRSYELVAKSWNGSGPMTLKYWKLVKAKL